MAFGLEADKLVETLGFLGNISAGTGKDLAELGVIYGQIRGAGRLLGQDLLQLINAGFNPLQVISQQTGKSIGELRKEMELGRISFEQVEGAFKSASEEGGLFFNLIEKQSRTLSGRFAKLTGNVEILARSIGK